MLPVQPDLEVVDQEETQDSGMFHSIEAMTPEEENKEETKDEEELPGVWGEKPLTPTSKASAKRVPPKPRPPSGPPPARLLLRGALQPGRVQAGKSVKRNVLCEI